MLDVLFWLAIGGLLISCLTAIGAKSLREFSRRELETLCRKYKVKPLLREILLHDDQVVVGVESLQKIATAVLLIAGSFWAVPNVSWPTFLAWTAVASLTLVVALVWIPWAMVHLWAAPFVFHSWRMLRFTSRIMAPLVFGARFFDIMVHRLAGRPVEKPTEELFEAEIRTLVSEGQREGLLEEDAREMIEGVIQLDDADVLEIMTPRTSVIMMHVGLSWDEVLKFVTNSRRTRIPVYDENRDDIVGVLYVKDLLPELIKSSGTPKRNLIEILRKPYYVPQTKRIDELLHDFQETHNHLAMVLDEYGGVSGLVTIEDVLEEIVGEIVDEYDEDIIEDIKQIDESSAEALGRAHLDEINERLGTDLPEDRDFDTIGGFVFSEVGHIPVVGEEVIWGGKVHITVLEVGRRRIERVKIEILAEAKRESA